MLWLWRLSMALEKDGITKLFFLISRGTVPFRCVLHPLAHDSLVFATTQAHKAFIPQLPQLIGTSRKE